jgi:type I restriction enzyme S subunit
VNATWETKQLADVAELQGRIGWKGLTAKEYTREGPYYLSVHSLNYGDFVDIRDAFHISQERYDESPEIMLRRDDVLICKDGAGIGKVGIVGELPGPTTINSSLLLLRPKSNILPKYLYLILQSPYFQAIVQSRLEGATTPHLYQRDIATFPVHLPPLDEQQRIVAALDESFAAIVTATANAQQNLVNARELFESELRTVFAQEAEVRHKKRLGDVLRTSAGGTPLSKNKDFYEGGTIPWLLSGEVGQRDITAASRFITEAGLQASSAKYYPINSVLVAMYGATAGEAGILRFESTSNQAVCAIHPHEKFVPEYVYYFVRSQYDKLVAQAVGNAQPNISQAKIREMPLPISSIEAQKEVVARLDAAWEGAEALTKVQRQKIALINDLKQSVLHRAFSGELTEREPLAA